MRKHVLNKRQSGFTLVELITVIVVLGILAAVAAPNFLDISSDARDRSIKNIAGTIKSANKMNRATKAALDKGVAIAAGSSCAAAVESLLDGGLDDGYTVTGTLSATVGAETDCTLSNDNGDQVTVEINSTE